MMDKKLFLLNSSILYREFTHKTLNDCLKRFMAFKVILNCMAFEDLINNRQFSAIRPIRDVFLAHKQNNDFGEAFNAVELINAKLIDELIEFMEGYSDLEESNFPELDNLTQKRSLLALAESILKKYESDFYSGNRISNNFLCLQEDQIKEISSNPIASVFYRYNSSKEFSILANYFISNLFQAGGYENALVNAKIDYALHAVNMCDCIFKDARNKFSLDGLYEILKTQKIGTIEPLEELKLDSNFWDIYGELRFLRNKLAGHMDKSTRLEMLLNRIEEFDFSKAFAFVNQLEKNVQKTAESHTAIFVNYAFNTQEISDEKIVKVKGGQNRSYI